MKTICGKLWLMILILSLTPALGYAADPKDMGGWEIDGAYNKLYQQSELDEFKGKVKDIIEVVPLKGMSPGVALVVKEKKGELITVHLGPAWFVKDHGIRKGVNVKVRGAWAEIGDLEVMMGSKIKWGDDNSYKVRLTKDGTPFWTLSAEELARERASQ